MSEIWDKRTRGRRQLDANDLKRDPRAHHGLPLVSSFAAVALIGFPLSRRQNSWPSQLTLTDLRHRIEQGISNPIDHACLRSKSRHTSVSHEHAVRRGRSSLSI